MKNHFIKAHEILLNSIFSVFAVDLENALDEKESALEKQIKKPAEERKKVTEDKENEEVNSKVHEEDTEIDHEDEKHNTVTVGEGPKSPHTSESKMC